MCVTKNGQDELWCADEDGNLLSTKYKKLKNKLTTNVFFEKCCLVYDQVSVN